MGRIFRMMMALALAFTATAAHALPVPVVTYSDVNLDHSNGEDWLRYCAPDGHTCTQIERDQHQLFLDTIALPQAIALAKSTKPYCDAIVTKTIDAYGAIEKVGLANYRWRQNQSSGFGVPATGSDYGKTNPHALADLRNCLTGYGKYLCAKSPFLTINMLVLLNLSIGRDAKGAAQCVEDDIRTLAHEAYDSHAADLGIVKPTDKLAPLTAVQSALLDACVEAHHLGVNVHPTCDTFVASATDIVQQRTFMLAPFSGLNGGWTDTENLKWKAIEHAKFTKWAGFVKQRDWLNMQRLDMDHVQTHVCQNLHGYGLQILLSIDGQPADSWMYQTCEEVLATN